MDILRVPPHDIDAEQSVIGGLLIVPGELDRVTDLVSEADFYRRDHRLLFRAIVELASKGTPPDAVTLGDWLEGRGLAADVGGAAYVVELASTVPGAANVRAYAQIVQQKAQLRRLIENATLLVNQAYNPGNDSVEQIIDTAVGAMMAMQKRDSNAEWTLRDAFKQAFARMMEASQNPGQIPGLPTGLAKLDEHLGGFHPSDLTVIGARPAMGKTALLFGMARHAAQHVGPVGIVSGEQPALQLGMRMLALTSGVSASRMRNGDLDETDWARITGAVSADSSLPLHILDRSAPHIAEVTRVARRWKREHGIRAIYVDYLQRMEGPGEKRWEQVTAIARGLKSIARDLDIPVIALAQVGRHVEQRTDKRPRMSDMSDASEIEKEADQVLTLYRDEYYNPDSADRGTAEIIIDKNRHGETAFCRVAWQPHLMRFADLEHGWTPMQRELPDDRPQPPRKARQVPARTHASSSASA